jgi:hypothetical protein
LQTRIAAENPNSDSTTSSELDTPSSGTINNEGHLPSPLPTPKHSSHRTIETTAFSEISPIPERLQTPQIPENVPSTSLTSRGAPRGPRREGIDESNILESSRRKPRREAHFVDVSRIDESSSFHTAFQVGTEHHRTKQRLHCTTVPPAPKWWKDLETHQFGREFRAAA